MALEDLLDGYGDKKFPLPDIAGTYKGKKIAVCGDAACVWDDLARLNCRYLHRRGAVASIDYQFMTINKLVENFPGTIEHAYSNEAEKLLKFIAARRGEYRAEGFEGPKHTHSCHKGAMWRWPWHGYGSSALGAALVSLALGYDEVVLCGVPLDDGPHNGEPPWRKCAFTLEVRSQNNGVEKDWKRAIDQAFDGRVRSMSGRTRQWLGLPSGVAAD